VNRLLVGVLGFSVWHHAAGLGSIRREGEERGQPMHQPSDVK